MKKPLRQPPEHHSSLRFLMSESKGAPYEAFPSLEEARQHPEGVIIFEGDDGGTIYLTFPANKTHCDEPALNQLLIDIDARYWKDPSMTRICYEKLPVGSGVAGGMGGGRVIDGLWLHKEVKEIGVEERIKELLAGTRKTIGSDP